MAFKVGSITANAELDTSNWEQGASKLLKSLGVMALATKAIGAVWDAMKESVILADEWQKSLSNVNTLLDETETNSQEMALSLLKLDARLGDTTELTDAMYQAFSAGAEDMDEALNITTVSAMFAKSALTDVSTAVDVITTAMNAYGDETMSAEMASDIFFTTIKQGKINGEQLASVIGKSIPLFASLNVPLEELGAGIATMTKMGVNASEATTQLNAIMNSFIKPSSAMTEALNSMGYASGSALIESEGLEGALQFLQETTGGNKEALGELLPSIEAVRGAMALTGVGGEEFAKILEEMENASGATLTAFEKQEMTFETFRNQMNKTQLVVGNIGKSFVDEIAVGATTASESMLQFLVSSSGAEVVGNIVGTLASTFHFLKALLEPLITTIFPVFGGVLTEVGLGIADLSNNAGESFGVMEFFSKGIQFSASALTIFGKMIEGVIHTVFNLVDAISASGGVVKNFWEFLAGDAEWSDVTDSVSNAGKAFADLATGFIDDQVDLFSTVGDQIVNFSDKVESTTMELNSSFTTGFSDAKDGVIENWDSLLTGQSDFAEDFTTNQQTMLDDLAEQTATANQNELDGLDEKKKSFFDYWNDITGYAGQALDYIQDYFDGEKEAELETIESNYEAQLSALTTRNENAQLNDIEYAKQKEALEQEKLAKENAVKKKQFENNKAWTIANIWLDAAAGAVNAWANNDWVTALLITGLVTAEAIASSVSANNQTFVPELRTGGMASGVTKINEQGGEIVSLPDGSQVIPHDISQKIAGNAGGGMTVNNYFNGTQVRSEADIEMISNRVASKIARDLRTA